MAYCSECGGGISEGTTYCRHCGYYLNDTPANNDPASQPPKKGGGFRKVLKWGGVGCGGVIGFFVILVIISGVVAALTENDNSIENTVPDEADNVGMTPEAPSHTSITASSPAPKPTTESTPTAMPTATSTPTPMPTATPTPVPIKMQLSRILEEYEKNKVRANTQLRYQENGKIPISTSGYVSEVEELYVVIYPTQKEYSNQSLYCYYADVGAALHLTKGQSVSITGKISGVGWASSLINMFSCAFEGIELEKNPTVSAPELRKNVVQIFCTASSLFSPGRKGTGVIVDAEEGTILTVHHVIADENECGEIQVEVAGIEGRVGATTAKHCGSIDRARLFVSPRLLAGLSLQPIYRAAAPAQTDQEVYFWGYGPGELRMETGIVMDVQGESIVTDAYAVPGDSGSPVFDEYGHLLGTMSKSNRSDRAVFTGNECE